MFDSFKSEQPVEPADVSLFLESERGRILHELEYGPTTEENRILIEEAMEGARAAAKAVMDNPTEENFTRARGYTAAMHAAFVINAVEGSLLDVAMYLKTPAAERQPDEAFLQTSSSLGKLILHGLKVVRWADRHEGKPLSQNNAISAAVAGTLAESMGGIREVKRLGNLYRSVPTYMRAPKQ